MRKEEKKERKTPPHADLSIPGGMASGRGRWLPVMADRNTHIILFREQPHCRHYQRDGYYSYPPTSPTNFPSAHSPRNTSSPILPNPLPRHTRVTAQHTCYLLRSRFDMAGQHAFIATLCINIVLPIYCTFVAFLL